jgi:hypothetical protein
LNNTIQSLLEKGPLFSTAGLETPKKCQNPCAAKALGDRQVLTGSETLQSAIVATIRPHMYRKQISGQLSINEFHLPFGGTLDRDNRWVLLSELIPGGPEAAKTGQMRQNQAV